MIQIEYSKPFQKSLRNLVRGKPHLRRKIAEKIELFQEDPFHPFLRSHKLVGNMDGLFSFSITRSIRVVYLWKGGDALFIDIGTHDEVYA